MAFQFKKPLPLFLFIFFLLHPFVSSERPISEPQAPATVYDLLPLYGFPKGIIPSSAKSYSLSSDGNFEIEFVDSSCYLMFKDQLVYYEKQARGKLEYGSVTGISGILTKKLFLWVPITGISSDDKTGMLEFHVGALSQKLPAKQFLRIQDCQKRRLGYGESQVVSNI
ncbi:uncharacterized protein LOC124922777 [Impatiens glandulifera]|uniref:uncharacterized protein LOC124922777 n=1 Tax=Impatiens glandulifera TaxID=253017 RepID=UPI001FB15BA0|nr:uncharacterized protein LOC124922777 [Impatiens glandulifera]